MSDEQDTIPRKRGRPKGSGKPKGTPATGKAAKGQPAPTLLNKRRRQYSASLMERIRERVDPDLLIDFHTMIMEGKTPIFEKIGDSDWRVIPDPSPLAVSPSLSDKIASVKWLTERGYGLPVQSIQVEAEFRAKLELMGSGVPTNVLENVNPKALAYLQKALQEASDPHPEAIDAEFTEVKDQPNENSPLPGQDSELISENKET